MEPLYRNGKLWLWLAWLLAVPISTPVEGQPRFAFDSTPGVLAKDVVPSEYRLALDLDPAKESFSGVVDISLKVRRAVDAIVLNAFELTAREVTLTNAAGTRSMAVTADKGKHQWRIADDRSIDAGEYTLRIAYSGVVHAAGEGLFVVPYTTEGKPARMLVTQLEPIAARTLFPGFDEPSFRASFGIAVTAPSTYEVVSNMPVRTRDVQGTSTLWHFAPTPPMPTYLVAVAIGQFDALAASVDGIPLRILTAKGKRESARYAMEVTKQVVPFYREYFGVPYALPKLDQLAVPGVRNGAMEDWGLISYNESNLLYDPAKSSIETKQGAFEVAAHEIAHQWFGNLVTAASWDEIWLNEAFATWMAKKATTHFNPDWQIPLSGVLWRQRVMRGDAGPATRAIRSGPVYETSVFDVFDGVTYTKGGAVLEMIETWIGADAFRRGINAYFEGQRLSNATAGDLWHYLSLASGMDIAAVARSWTDQPGYPLLLARTSCVQGKRTLEFEQQRFRTDGVVENTSLWKIPLAVNSGGAAPTRFLLTEREAKFIVGPCTASPLFIDSSGGFFRVQYAPDHLRQLANTFHKMAPSARLALLTDTFALGQAGRMPLTAYFALVSQLQPAADPATQVLYLQIENALLNLDGALAGTPAQKALRKFGRSKLGPMFAQLGWKAAPGESAVTLGLRNDLIDALGRFGDESTLRKSSQLFASERMGGPMIDPSIRRSVMANVARRADAEIYAELVRRLVGAERVEDGWLYASALAQVEDPKLAQGVLALSLDDKVPSQIAAWIPGMVSESYVHAEKAYAFARDNYAALSRRQAEDLRPFLLSSAASGFNDPARARTLMADQQRLLGDAGEKAAKEGAADIELKGRIKNRESGSLAAKLSQLATGKH